jgi:putative nucleotidyltransferase with HDIG domain
MCALFGADDGVVKRHMKLVDWHDRARLALATWRLVALGGPLGQKARQFLGIARTEHMTRDLMQVRCERGADIALRLGFPAPTAEAIRSLDEHWNGGGYPRGLAGEAIPLLARVCNVAQVAEVFLAAHGPAGAVAVARERAGRWFDPEIVRVVVALERDRDWWRRVQAPDVAASVTAVEPADRVRQASETDLDAIARAFADIIDAKTPFTFHHSTNVAAYAEAIGAHLGMDDEGCRRLRRAGLLHDIGKLGVSNRILDKAGRLDAAERRAIELHPVYSMQILQHVRAFGDFAWMASVHHEKLDGSGYPWRLTGESLDAPMRVLAVADIYEALTADRPYRTGMPPERALGIVASEAGPLLCADAVTALRECVDAGTLAVA